MSESELRQIYICVQCGWRRPEGWNCLKCAKCGGTLKPVILKDHETINKALAQPCEKANNTCKFATDLCHAPLPYDPMRSYPGKRWIDCWGWKTTLGLTLDLETGVYLPPKCPCCGANLIKHYQKKKKSLETLIDLKDIEE